MSEALAWNDPTLEAAEGAICGNEDCGHTAIDHDWHGCPDCGSGCNRSPIHAYLTSSAHAAHDAKVRAEAVDHYEWGVWPDGEGQPCRGPLDEGSARRMVGNEYDQGVVRLAHRVVGPWVLGEPTASKAASDD